jgi:hypothetical protein
MVVSRGGMQLVGKIKELQLDAEKQPLAANIADSLVPHQARSPSSR